MRFRQHQAQSRAATRALLLLFALVVALMVLAVNAALALVWWLQTGGLFDFPRGFFAVNTALTLGYVLGGVWIESLNLRDGGAHVARLIGGREVLTPRDFAERRLRNIVDEMAIASGLKPPRVFVLDREQAINALAAGWEAQDSVVAVTRGALERLSRDELQGVVAHEFAHILNGDTRLNMRLVGMVFGLQVLYTLGRSLMSPDALGRRSPAVLAGVALVAVGSIGWLAGRLLKAAVSRQREHLADAHAVQFTRLPDGIGGALRKIAHQQRVGRVMQHANAEIVSPLLLSSHIFGRGGWLATHPPIAERLRRIFGREMPPLEDAPVPEAASASGADLPALGFAPVAVGAAATDGSQAAGEAFGLGAEAATPSEATGAAAPRTAAEQALMALPGWSPPGQLQAAVLAFLVPAAQGPERDAWNRITQHTPGAARLLDAVLALPPARRQPWFERVLLWAAARPADEREALRRDALILVRADGRLSLHEFLAARLLRHDIGRHGDRLTRETRVLAPADLTAEIALLTVALAALLPAGSRSGWPTAVLAALDLPPPAAWPEGRDPRALAAALDRLAQLAPVARPALAKSWLQTLPGPPPQPLADALRCLCLLIDTPLPPRLANCFEPLPAWE